MFRGALRKPLFWAVMVFAVLLDQVTKIWAVKALEGNPPIRVVGDFLKLRLTRNPGAAFSIGTGHAWVFVLVALAVVLLILFYARRIDVPAWYLSLSFVLAGAIGNLIDRVAQPPGFLRGHVIDFIDYNGYFVGNIADIYIVCAVALIVVLTFLGTHTRKSDRDND